MPTAPSIPDNCPHERRPGLTVCLHCRHAAREAEAAKRRRSFSRAVLVGAVVGLGVMIALAAVRASDDTTLPTLASVSSTPADSAPAVASAPSGPASSPTAPSDSAVSDFATSLPAASVSAVSVPAASPAAPELAVAEVTPPPAPLAPVVAQGRTELPEGLSVVRAGDSLTVHFDTELGRTRRPEKFERTVRTTLPLLYGARAESLLAHLPAGAIAGAGELLTELPARGVRIPTNDGRTLVVRPETRPGRDGPLVVRYIATIER